MYARESEVWGSDENTSPVHINVVSNKQRSTREPDDYGFDKFGPEAYALFSAKQNNKSLIKEGLRFALQISVPNQPNLQLQRESQNEWRRKKRMGLLPSTVQDIFPDVSVALWTWIQFGGIGSRTRRGLGALHCMNWPEEILQHRPSNWPGVVLLKGSAINSESVSPHSRPGVSLLTFIRNSGKNSGARCIRRQCVAGNLPVFRAGPIGRNLIQFVNSQDHRSSLNPAFRAQTQNPMSTLTTIPNQLLSRQLFLLFHGQS